MPVTTNFATGTMSLTLTQKDMATAVEYWLNNKIMKVPIQVVGMAKNKGLVHSSETFNVIVVEEDNKEL